MSSIPRLMIVTRGQAPGELIALLETLAGPALVQLRDKRASGSALAERARRLAPHCALSINAGGAPIDARAAGARFVHLPEGHQAPGGDLPCGRSVHSIEAARRAAPKSAYLVAGPVWPSAGKPDGLGLEVLEAICIEARGTPVLAIGGILGPERARAARAAGAHGVAGIRAFADARAVALSELLVRS